eukprot:GDKI01029577.1.p1 GENE.GDKI01029577.1~~GDKI01029577.1.p1  ORF type:complete len:313 (+),score=66.75 GDKI01029577.1:51-989(+)
MQNLLRRGAFKAHAPRHLLCCLQSAPGLWLQSRHHGTLQRINATRKRYQEAPLGENARRSGRRSWRPKEDEFNKLKENDPVPSRPPPLVFEKGTLFAADSNRMELAPDGSERQVYRRVREEHQRVFRWGVGNKWLAMSQNRQLPVHKERPRELTVRNNYYDHPDPHIVWEDLNEAWEVYWYEHGKLNAKPFPVKKFGVEQCKSEAVKFLNELKEKGRFESNPRDDPKFASDVEGVSWDHLTSCWVAFSRRKNRPVCRSFSADVHGFEQSKRLAERKRRLYMREAESEQKVRLLQATRDTETLRQKAVANLKA